MKFNNYIFRSHMVGRLICTGKPLTQRQMEMLEEFDRRASGEGRPLTEKQTQAWHELNYKFNQSKMYTLTDSQKAILRDLVRQDHFGYRNVINANELEKGLLVEKESRDLLSEILMIPLVKDDERRSNDFVTGKRDIKSDGLIIDIKSAFSHSSFSKMLDEEYKENELYLWQMDSYMELWDCKESIIAHVLVDSPLSIINSLIYQVVSRERLFNAYTEQFSEEGWEVIESIVHNHIVTEKALDKFCANTFEFGNTYIEFRKSDFKDWNETPKDQRVHMIKHDFDANRIEQRNQSIITARNYMNTVEIKNNIIYLKK